MKKLSYLIFSIVFISTLAYLFFPKGTNLIIDEASRSLALDINKELELLKDSELSRCKNRILFLLNNNKGFDDLIDMQSGLVDGISSSPDNYTSEFKCYALTNAEFKSMILTELRSVEIKCLELLKQKLLESDSALFHDLILEKVIQGREAVGIDYSLVPVTSHDSKIIDSAIISSYKAFLQRDLPEKLSGGITRKTITNAVLVGVSDELKSSIETIIAFWEIRSEKHDHSYFSDRTYVANLKEKALVQIHHLIFLKKAQNSFSEKINEFTQKKLNESRVSDFLDKFAGLYDGSLVALKDDHEKNQYTQKEFEQYIFSKASLRKLFQQGLMDCRLIAIEEANACAFEIESLQNPDINQTTELDLKIPRPDSDVPTLIQVAEMSDQLLISIEAGVFVGGLVAALPTGGQSLWASLGIAIYEFFRLIGDFTVVEAQKVEYKTKIRELSSAKIIQEQAGESISKLNAEVEKVFHALIAK